MGINVLSLFDGISCGQLALERAGIDVDTYYASEIDQHAISVTQHHYPNTIQLGSITDVFGSQLPKIDLLIGGSPCQGFSFNGKQLNFDDPRSALFFEYVRLWNECKPKYWLLENVRMKRESEDVITKILGVKPIIINSRLVSAQNRHRLYWTNIPGVFQPEDRNIHIDSILGPHDGFWLGEWGKSKPGALRKVDKAPTVQCSHYKKYVRNGIRECFTTAQLEALQTLPIGYTNILKKTRAEHAIGNGWTVDVIAHIFTAMKNDMNGIKVALDKFI